jgi:hypothetical protein
MDADVVDRVGYLRVRVAGGHTQQIRCWISANQDEPVWTACVPDCRHDPGQQFRGCSLVRRMTEGADKGDRMHAGATGFREDRSRRGVWHESDAISARDPGEDRCIDFVRRPNLIDPAVFAPLEAPERDRVQGCPHATADREVPRPRNRSIRPRETLVSISNDERSASASRVDERPKEWWSEDHEGGAHLVDHSCKLMMQSILNSPLEDKATATEVRLAVIEQLLAKRSASR